MDAEPISPCKDCLNRFVGCHSTCDKYAEWKQIHAAAMNARRHNHDSHSNFNLILRDRWLQSKTKKRR